MNWRGDWTGKSVTAGRLCRSEQKASRARAVEACCGILDSHGIDYEEHYHLGGSTVHFT